MNGISGVEGGDCGLLPLIDPDFQYLARLEGENLPGGDGDFFSGSYTICIHMYNVVHEMLVISICSDIIKTM